jgi:hypothetical protein
VLPHQEREVQSGRPAADDVDSHGHFKRKLLPGSYNVQSGHFIHGFFKQMSNVQTDCPFP